jgi:hypothetical protein
VFLKKEEEREGRREEEEEEEEEGVWHSTNLPLEIDPSYSSSCDLQDP